MTARTPHPHGTKDANRCAVPQPKPFSAGRVSDATRLRARIDAVAASRGLGRLCAPDARDKNFPMSALVRAAVVPKTKTWATFVKPLDQGPYPHCVAYAWTQFLLAAPMPHSVNALTTGAGGVSGFTGALYHDAQQVDEWPGDGYDGTSVRAGAKVLVKRQNLATGYVWAHSAAQARDFVCSVGPVVFGTWWYERMFAPTEDGTLLAEGDAVGGHAYLIIGYSVARDAFRVLNSWGSTWGQKGRAWLRFADAERLIAEDGEACSAVEIKTP